LKRVLAAAACLLAAAGCLDPPVTESVEIRFGESEIEVLSLVRLNRGEYDSGPAAERIDRWARRILDRTDESTRRIEALEPREDEEIVRREKGAVFQAERKARIDDASTLQRLFLGSSVSTHYAADPDGRWKEFTLTVPDGGTARTPEERRALRELEAWAADATRFVRAEHALYAHLASNPGRAVPCLETANGGGDGSDLSADELALASEVSEARDGVLAALQATADREDTLDERIQRVFDPFPTELSVVVTGTVTEREGFVDGPDGGLAVPRRGAWAAFRSIEGRWVAPDLLVETWREKDGGKVDLATFAPRIRAVSKTPPTDAEVFDAFRKALRPVTTFRVRWEPEPEPPPPPPEPPAE
jgi:hypothetical protein